MTEYWDVYDKNRKPVGRLHKRSSKPGEYLKPGDYHLVCEAWIITPDNRLLITQRHPNKHYGTKWECTGGAVIAGEDSRQGIIREIKEEVGIQVSDDELEFVSTAWGANYFTDYFLIRRDIKLDELVLQEEEVTGARLVTPEEFISLYKQGKLVPNLYRYMKEIDFYFLKGKHK
ncbi:MAG: NUDIX domain-containing protein [Eubacterium sp.]|nr:NUDIX domain-containing protein [Eubacterium sp.]